MCEKSFSQAQIDSRVMHAKKNFGTDISAKIKANNGFWACTYMITMIFSRTLVLLLVG